MKILMRPSFHPNLFATARLLILAACCVWGSPLHAQNADQRVPAPGQHFPQKLSLEELGQLLAPIALYPDALIALILPASTVPSDVVLGARYLQANGDPERADIQPWDESVKSLMRYPEVLAWMDQNLEWTASVGEAFVDQPADVMNTLQALREQARAAGNLQDTPQQRVVVEDDYIRIVPADPQVIFVPQYDPEVIYVESYSPMPLLTFGVGYGVGSWLSYDFDWNRRCIYRGHWRGWDHDWNNDYRSNRYRRGDSARVVNIDFDNANPWQPSADSQRQTRQRQRNDQGNARYVGARSGAMGAGQQAVQQSATSLSNQTGRYNPALQTALPRPSRMERTTRGTDGTRDRAPARSVNPADLLPSSPVQVPGQMNNLPLNQTQDRFKRPGRSESPSATPGRVPQPGVRSPASLPPQILPSGEQVQPQPTVTDKQGSRHQKKSDRQVILPTQPAPDIQQPGQLTPGQQVQPPRQQARERKADQQPSQQAPERQKIQQPRQQAPERQKIEPPRQQAPERQKIEQPRQQAPERQKIEQPRQQAPERQRIEQPRQQAPERQRIEQPRQQKPERQPAQQPQQQAPSESKAQPASGGEAHPDKKGKKKDEEKKAE